SVLHHSCSQLRHETASPQLENSARFTALRPRPPRSDRIPTSRPVSHRFPPSILLPTLSKTSTSASVPTPANFNTSASLHSICIRTASAAPAASFGRLFRTAAPISVPLHTTDQGRASEKALTSATRNGRGKNRFELIGPCIRGIQKSDSLKVKIPTFRIERWGAADYQHGYCFLALPTIILPPPVLTSRISLPCSTITK